MRKFLIVALAFCAVGARAARSAEPAVDAAPAGTSSATAADVEALRQQVQSLTTMVQALQQQVRDQQAALEKNNSTAPSLPQNPEAQSAETSSSPAPTTSSPPLFPTADIAFVASSSLVYAYGAVTAPFPTSDSSISSLSTTVPCL